MTPLEVGLFGLEPLHLVATGLVKASVVLIVLLLAVVSTRHLSAHLRYWIGNLAVVSLLGLALFSFVTPIWEFPILPGEQVVAASQIEPAYAEEFNGNWKLVPVVLAHSLESKTLTPSAGYYLLIGLAGLWGAGAILLLLRMFGGVLYLHRVTRRAQSAVADWNPVIVLAAQTIGMEKHPDVRLSPEVPVPMIWGVFRPVVLLPETSRSWGKERVSVVLTHEFVHAQRGDHVMALVTQLVVALFWINPLVWWLAKQQRCERELACDEAVLTLGADKITYAEQLVAMTQELRTSGPINAVAMATPSRLAERVGRVLNHESGIRFLNRSTVRASLFAAAMLAAPLATANLVKTEPFSQSPYINQLFNGECEQRTFAAEHLGKEGNRDAVPFLIQALIDPEQKTRVRTVRSLGELNDTRAMIPLQNLLQDRNPEVRAAAASALGSIDSPVVRVGTSEETRVGRR